MKIFAQSSYLKNNPINFSSGLIKAQAKYIENLDTQKVEHDIKKKYNVECDFAKSPIVAGFSEKTFDVFQALDRKLPTSIKTFDFPVPVDGDVLPSESATAYVIWASKNSNLTGRINFNRKYNIDEIVR